MKNEIREAIAHVQSDRKERAIEILEGLAEEKPKHTFTLVVRPDGRAILATEKDTDPETLRAIAEAFHRWRTTANDILVLGNTQCVTVLDIKLELPQGMDA